MRKRKIEAELKASVIQAACRGGKVRKEHNKRVKELEHELAELAKQHDGEEALETPAARSSTARAPRTSAAHQSPMGDPATRADSVKHVNQMRAQLRQYIKQLEEKKRGLERRIEKLKRERLYLDIAGQRECYMKRRGLLC